MNDQPLEVSAPGFRTLPCRACRVPIIVATHGEDFIALDVEPHKPGKPAPEGKPEVLPPDVLLIPKPMPFYPLAVYRTQEQLFGEERVYQRHSRTCERSALLRAQARMRRNAGRTK